MTWGTLQPASISDECFYQLVCLFRGNNGKKVFPVYSPGDISATDIFINDVRARFRVNARILFKFLSNDVNYMPCIRRGSIKF